VCDQETSKTRRLKPATWAVKIQPQWVVTPRRKKIINYKYGESHTKSKSATLILNT